MSGEAVSEPKPASPARSTASSGASDSSPIVNDPAEYKRSRAWKYEGYKAFSNWIDSSNDFLMVRRFGALNVRALLMMQDKIVCKEDELRLLDEQVEESVDDNDRNYSFRWDKGSRRETLMEELIPLLEQYNRFVITLSDLKARSSASEDQINNVRNWFTNHPNAVRNDGGINEQDFINKGGDVIPIVPRSKSPLRQLFERFRTIRWNRIFSARFRGAQDGLQNSTVLTSDRGFEWFVTIACIIGGLGLLQGPMWWLAFVIDPIMRLTIITIFITAFTILLTAATTHRPFEVLAASAAYAAVLMVFLQVQPDTDVALSSSKY